MKRRRTNIEGLCGALNAIGIRTTIPGRTTAKANAKQNARSVEKARRKSLNEISRIARNAKRLTSS